MRTTVSLDDDVAAAVQRMRAERNIGLRTFPMGARIDVTNVGDALEYLEGHSHR